MRWNESWQSGDLKQTTTNDERKPKENMYIYFLDEFDNFEVLCIFISFLDLKSIYDSEDEPENKSCV